MSNAQDAVSRLTIQTSAPGADAAADSMNRVAEAMGGVTVSSSSMEKGTSSLDSKFASIERRYNDQVKALQDYQKIQNTVNAAVAQNPALLDRGNAVLAVAKQRYDDATGSQSLFAKSLVGVQSQMVALSAGLGPVGTGLAALGPVGLVVGAALALVSAGFSELKDQANAAGEWAATLQNAANVTGLNTTQLQALNEVSASVGVSANDNISAFERFSVSLGQLKDGTGTLYTQLLKVNPALVSQLLVTRNAADAWNLLATAYANANQQQQPLISRAAFGRNGAAEGAVLQVTANAGGINNLSTENTVSTDQIAKWAQLTTQINAATEAASHNFQKIFTADVLKSELDFANGMLKLSQAANSFAFSDDFHAFINFMTDPKTLMVLAALAAVAAVATAPVSLPVAAGLAVAGAGVGAGAIVNGITNAGAPAAAPQQITNTGGTTSQDNSPYGPNQPNLTAQIVAQKAYSSALGDAATASDTLKTKTLELNQAYQTGALGAVDSTDANAKYAKALSALNLNAAITTQNAYNSALGASTPISDLVAAKDNALQALRLKNPAITQGVIDQQRALTAAQALGTYQIDAQTAAEGVKQKAIGMSVGAAAEYTAEQTRLDKAIQDKQPLDATELANLHASAVALGVKTQAAAQDAAQSKADFDLQTAGLSGVEQQIAQMNFQLHQNNWKDFMNDGVSATMRVADAMKTLKGQVTAVFQQAAGDILNGIESGQSKLQIKATTLNNVSSTLNNQAMTNMFSGDPMKMMAVPSQIIWGALAKQAANAAQAQLDFENAGVAYAGMAKDIAKFTDTLTGSNTGSLGSSISAATQQAQTYADAAHKAGQSSDALNAALIVFSQKATRDFMNTFSVTIEALNEGLGMDSPAVKAAANVKSIGDTLKGFIDDTVKAGQGLASAGPAITAATASSQAYALSLLQTPPVLTTVQTALLTLRGNAQQLQTTLQDLGMSAGAAGDAISTGIKAALAGISATFAQGLQAQINSASGKDYINQINALLTQGASNLSDAQSLGMDPALVAQAFQAQAQQIIDSAGLVGSAFDGFIAQFPELAGVVNQSTTAIKSLSDATTQFYAALKTTIATYLHNLNTGAQSALSPQGKLASAQSDYNTQLALAQGGNRDAIGNITQYSSDLLTAAKDYFASSAGYANILSQVQVQLASLPDMAAANDPVVEQLMQVSTNTGNTVATLSALQAIQAATQNSSVNISASVTQLGAQTSYVAATQGDQYFGPMNAYLSQIAANTRLAGQAAAAPKSSFEWYNPFTWFAEGGSVTGGMPGKDSVMAMLTPNEFVVKPGPASAYLPMLQAMNAGMLPPLRHFADGGSVMSVPLPQIAMPTLNYINSTGQNPGSGITRQDLQDALRAVARSGSNDNQRLMEKLDEMIEVLEDAPQKTKDAFRHLVGASKPRAA
jgi:hypothetical protein